MLCSTVARRMRAPSRSGLRSGERVLITRSISPERIRSMMLGEPSWIFCTAMLFTPMLCR